MRSCRTRADLQKLSQREVSIDTNPRFMSYYPPDLALPAGHANGIIKGWDYGSPGYVNAAYAWDSGETTLKELNVLVVVASKTEAKGVLSRLRARADYGAFVDAALKHARDEHVAMATEQKAAYLAIGDELGAAAVDLEPPPFVHSYEASEAYVFECVPSAASLVHVCMPVSCLFAWLNGRLSPQPPLSPARIA